MPNRIIKESICTSETIDLGLTVTLVQPHAAYIRQLIKRILDILQRQPVL